MKIKIKPFIKWESALLLFFVIELIGFGLLTPGFLNIGNLLYSVNDFVYIGLAAIPMTLVIITGGIDVSVGSIMGLTSILVGVLFKSGVNIWVAILIALAVSVLAGCINGGLVVFTGVQPLVVTLGGMFLFSGIALVISGSSGATGYEGISGFPDFFVQLINGKQFGIPDSILFFIAALVVFGALLHFTRYGRNVFLVGMNRKAARYSGIHTRWTILSTYMLSGLGGGFGGVVLTSYFGSARADLGSDAILSVITAVVLGGTSIFGGRGSVFGTFIASIVVGIMQYGLQLSNMQSQQTQIVVGAMLIVSVALRQSNWVGLKKMFTRPQLNMLYTRNHE